MLTGEGIKMRTIHARSHVASMGLSAHMSQVSRGKGDVVRREFGNQSQSYQLMEGLLDRLEEQNEGCVTDFTTLNRVEGIRQFHQAFFSLKPMQVYLNLPFIYLFFLSFYKFLPYIHLSPFVWSVDGVGATLL